MTIMQCFTLLKFFTEDQRLTRLAFLMLLSPFMLILAGKLLLNVMISASVCLPLCLVAMTRQFHPLNNTLRQFQMRRNFARTFIQS
jgi:hypothetical protein